MRSDSVTSPQPAACAVAVTLAADGDIGETWIDWLDRHTVSEHIGLAQHELPALLDTLYEDSLPSGQLKLADVCPVGEIQDPVLRIKLLRLCVARAQSDAHVPEGDSLVLIGAVEHWRLYRETFRSSSRI